MKGLPILAAWLLATLVVVFSLGPSGLRPQFGHPQIERFLGFLTLSLCWGAVVPGRLERVFVALTGAAILLEAGQALVPGRHPGVPDAIAKICGVLVGVALVAVVRRLRSPWPRSV